MSSELTEDWLGCVWVHRAGALSKPRSMLAMDTFRGHLSDRIRNTLRNKTHLVIIPSGMISQLQPLDVSINNPFNHSARKNMLPGSQSYIDTYWQNKESISVNSSEVYTKSLERGASECYSKLFFKVLFV
jgi:hypothetical protein